MQLDSLDGFLGPVKRPKKTMIMINNAAQNRTWRIMGWLRYIF